MTDTLVLHHAPDWTRPEQWLPVLAAYLGLVPAEAPCLLHLDVGDELPGAVVADLAMVACERLSGGTSFGDVALDTGAPDGPFTAVAGRDALAAAVGAALPAPPSDPRALVDHARWAKGIVDELQQRIDRWRFEATPAPVAAGTPLISVRIPTYGDVTELTTRALPSVLHGTWQNVEVVVCSDGPQPHARAAVEAVTDPRVRYVELPERPPYPSQPYAFWRVGGIPAINHALDHCRGDFICPLDHDDAFTVDHVAKLLETAARTGADFVYGQAVGELRAGPWYLCGRAPLTEGHIAHGAVLYSRRLAHLRMDHLAWLIEEPADWNLWRRFQEVGARVEYVPEPVLVHFKQRTSIEDDPNVTDDDLLGDPPLDLELAAQDVLRTAARPLLDVLRPAGALVSAR